jgi:hypothetical protein
MSDPTVAPAVRPGRAFVTVFNAAVLTLNEQKTSVAMWCYVRIQKKIVNRTARSGCGIEIPPMKGVPGNAVCDGLGYQPSKLCVLNARAPLPFALNASSASLSALHLTNHRSAARDGTGADLATAPLIVSPPREERGIEGVQDERGLARNRWVVARTPDWRAHHGLELGRAHRLALLPDTC